MYSLLNHDYTTFNSRENVLNENVSKSRYIL